MTQQHVLYVTSTHSIFGSQERIISRSAFEQATLTSEPRASTESSHRVRLALQPLHVIRCNPYADCSRTQNDTAEESDRIRDPRSPILMEPFHVVEYLMNERTNICSHLSAERGQAPICRCATEEGSVSAFEAQQARPSLTFLRSEDFHQLPLCQTAILWRRVVNV